MAGAGAGALLVSDYKPLYQCIQDMPEEKKQEIARKIENRVGNPGKQALMQFVRALPENAKWVREQIQA